MLMGDKKHYHLLVQLSKRTMKSAFFDFMRDVSKVRSHCFDLEKHVATINMKLRGNVYEGSLNTKFFAVFNLIMSFSIFESLRKK